jgi:hypothetical protein
MTVFRETIWNSHRVRCQKDAQMPKEYQTTYMHFLTSMEQISVVCTHCTYKLKITSYSFPATHALH